MTKELEEARQAMLEGRGLQAELERQAEERLEKEREKRIEGNANMAMRRMQNKELSRDGLPGSSRTGSVSAWIVCFVTRAIAF